MKNLNLNIKKILSLKGCAFVLTTITGIATLVGCGEVDCNIDGNHAHLYTNADGYQRFISKEKSSYHGYERSDYYIRLDEEELKICEFETKNDLLRINENLPVINQAKEENQDYIEYRYTYMYLLPIPHTVSTGKTTTTYFTYIPMRGYSWTKDKDHSNLTGEQRRCHYVYQGCKIIKNAKGKYEINYSDYVDDILEISDEYTHIKEKYFKVIDAEYGNDLDYEDGSEDDKKLIDDEVENQDTDSKELKMTNKRY